MSYELKPGQGSIFKADKGDNEQRPDYTGSLNIDGTVWRIAGWVRLGKAGKYLSLKAELPRAEQAALESKPQDARKPAQIDPDDSIPF